jgi:hemerythrin-like metal-binding protein
MTALAWSEALALKQPRMDQTHREFVDLLQGLGAAHAAGVTEVDALLEDLLTHTEAHFAQEERWMADIGFAPQNCHSMQHAQVLKVLTEVRRVLADDGDRAVIGVLVEELGQWFVAHAQMMDAALAGIMVERGYDPETGRVLNPVAADAQPITGCGGSSCS